MTGAPPATLRVGDTEVARIGLGTNRLAHTPVNVAFIREAVAAGIGLVDTAHVYQGGQSEAAIGDALSARQPGCVVATKGGWGHGEGRRGPLTAQIEESLRRLRADAIDLFYLHRVDPETPFEETLGVLREHLDAGRLRHVGLSQVSVEQIERARRVLPVTAVQNHYNLGERANDAVVDHCAREGIVFVPYFPLRAGHPALEAIARDHGATPAQITLAWLLRRSSVMLPIPGTLSTTHARNNLAALDIELTDAEAAALRRL